MNFNFIHAFFSCYPLVSTLFLMSCSDPEPAQTPVLPQAHPKEAQFPICPQGWCWENPTTGGNPIRALWGTQEKDIWAVGDLGTILHYDGQNWSLVPSPTKANLKAVWGSGYDNVYAVGEQGTLLHYTETSGIFTPIVLGTSATLWSLWGNSEKNIWVVGAQGALFFFDGNTFTKQHFLQNPAEESNYNLTGIWGNAQGQFFMGGGKTSKNPDASVLASAIFLMFDGNNWLAQPPIVLRPHADPNTQKVRVGIWGFEPNDVWAVVCFYFDDGNPREESLYHFEENQWKEITKTPLDWEYYPETSPTDADFHRIWGLSNQDLFLPGPTSYERGGVWDFHHKDDWSFILIHKKDVYAVWGTSKTNLWLAVGNGGLAHFNGNQIDINTNSISGALGGPIWIQNDHQIQASIIHSEPPEFYKSKFKLLTGYKDHFIIDSQMSANSIWPIDDNHAYLRTDHQKLYVWDGTTWKPELLFPQIDQRWLDVKGSLPDQVLAVGDVPGHPIYSFNGTTWTKEEQLTIDLLKSTDPTTKVSLSRNFFVNSLQDAWFSGHDYTPNPEPRKSYTYWLKHVKNGDITSSPTQLLQGPILSVWGSDPSHLWATDGVFSGLYFSDGETPLFRFDPTHFADANKNNEHPSEIWGRSASDFWVRTQENSMFHYNGTSWHQKQLPAVFDSTAKLTGSKQGKGVWLFEENKLLHYLPEFDK